jgi:hypothetical protein
LIFTVIVMTLPSPSRDATGHSATRERILPDIPAGSPEEVKRLVAQSLHLTSLPPVVMAQIPHAIGDNAATILRMPDSCGSATSCVYGDRHAASSMVLFGDSHARMWIGAINPLAQQAHLRLIVLGHNGCPLVAVQVASGYSPSCVSFRTQALQVIRHLHPKVVVLTNRTTYDGVSEAQWQSSLRATVHELRPSGAQLLMIGDIQEFSVPLPDCLARFHTHVNSCVAHEIVGRETTERNVARDLHVPYIDPRPWLCTHRRCSPVIGSFIAYWNPQHVSYRYSEYLATVMGNAITARVRLN